MRRLYLLIMIFVGFNLSSCAVLSSSDQPIAAKVVPVEQTQPTTTTTTNKPQKKSTPQTCPYNKKPKNPLAVLVYPKGAKLTHPYTVIAKETISKYNSGGIVRQEANIRDALRNVAASVGGDAVINITREHDKVVGTIVSFEKNDVG